jgi:hypothetical protein
LTAPEQRASRRDRILLLARLRVHGDEDIHAIRIRDLSADGLRAQCTGLVIANRRVEIEIRNLGWVEGRVAWHNEEYIGVRFAKPIDPEKTRIAVTGAYQAPPPSWNANHRRL